MRRAFDVVTAATVLLLSAPLLALIWLAVWLSLGSPVVYRQRRVGLKGKNFTILKFRSMRPPRTPAETDAERSPWLGRILRATSLDELPQLWNVLRGDMSLIGPRPTLPQQVRYYSPRQRGRLEIRPGLTGWAQVRGRNSIDWPARIELDLWYIGHRSLCLDLRILARTLGRLARPAGVTGAGGVNPGFPLPGDLATAERADRVGAPERTNPKGGGETV